MKFKAIIFDLDGVLVDSEGFQYQGWLPPLKRFGVDLSKEQYFDYAGRSGPRQTLILKQLNHRGLQPENCVAIEDTEFGTASAKGAGMACVAIPDEWPVKQNFGKADKVCKDLKEAIEWIKAH